MGKAIMTVMLAFGTLERDVLMERTRAGLVLNIGPTPEVIAACQASGGRQKQRLWETLLRTWVCPSDDWLRLHGASSLRRCDFWLPTPWPGSATAKRNFVLALNFGTAVAPVGSVVPIQRSTQGPNGRWMRPGGGRWRLRR